MQGGTAHCAPGLGQQNPKQRLGEYAAERGVVLGFAVSAATSGAVGGRTKHVRGVGVHEPDSDEMDDDGVGTDSEEIEEEDEEDMVVDALAARVTIVFEGGRSSALPGTFNSSPPRIVLMESRPVFCEFSVNADSSISRMHFGRPSCARDRGVCYDLLNSTPSRVVFTCGFHISDRLTGAL